MEKNERKLPSEILDGRIEVIETYKGLAKGVFGGIPYIGTLLNELFFEIPNRIQQERINEMVIELKSRLDSLPSKLISEDYLKSDDFYDFTRIVFESVLKVKTEKKRKLLANIYVSSIVKQSDFEDNYRSMFLRFISDLSSFQIQLLAFIASKEDELEEIESYQNFYDLFYENIENEKIDKYQFKYYCIGLDNMSLVSCGEGLEEYDVPDYEIEVAGNYKKPSVNLTSLGNKFVEFMTE